MKMRNYDEKLEDPRCYVTFSLQAEEDRDAMAKAGHVVMKDVEYVDMIPIGDSKTVVVKRVDEAIRDRYRAIYDAWRKGEEIPEDGTPLKHWPILGPAQLKNVLRMQIRTVEDLAKASEDSLMGMGPGARGLKQRAEEWLLAAKTTGIPALEIGRLADEVKDLKDKLKKKAERVKDLQAVIVDFKKENTP